MSNLCKQCSIEMVGDFQSSKRQLRRIEMYSKDFEDVKGGGRVRLCEGRGCTSILDPALDGRIVLCEGCGDIEVDEEGSCTSNKCKLQGGSDDEPGDEVSD